MCASGHGSGIDEMTDSNDTAKEAEGIKKRSLKDALYVVRNRQAERDDVVVDMKAAEETRLELLADELLPLLDDIDESDERFEFAMSRGDRPRFWVDMTSFVAMGHDRRTYRFLKDTRMGRTVLAESGNMEQVADSVSQYIAERVLERERAIEGEWMSLKEASRIDEAVELDETTSASAPAVSSDETIVETVKRPSIWRSVMTFLFGCAVTLVAIALAARYLVPDAF